MKWVTMEQVMVIIKAAKESVGQAMRFPVEMESVIGRGVDSVHVWEGRWKETGHCRRGNELGDEAGGLVYFGMVIVG